MTIMRIRIGADGDDDEDSDWNDEGEDQSWIRGLVSPPDLGRLFVRLALAFALLTALSMLALVVVLLLESEEPFVDQPHLEDPISGWLWLLSLTGTAISVFGYTAWSFWQQRQLRHERRLADPMATTEETPLYKRPVRALQIATTDNDELDEYEKRVQKTVTALILGLFVGYLPGRIALGVLLGI